MVEAEILAERHCVEARGIALEGFAHEVGQDQPAGLAPLALAVDAIALRVAQAALLHTEGEIRVDEAVIAEGGAAEQGVLARLVEEAALEPVMRRNGVERERDLVEQVRVGQRAAQAVVEQLEVLARQLGGLLAPDPAELARGERERFDALLRACVHHAAEHDFVARHKAFQPQRVQADLPEKRPVLAEHRARRGA